MEEVELTLDNDELLQLCLMAHKRDMTLNALVTEILTEQITRLEKETNVC
jgi:predicted DNA-binding ribbon-helix-helix protein